MTDWPPKRCALIQLFTLLCSAFSMSTSVHAADDWSFIVSPYVWFAGAQGDLSVIPGASATSINVSPTEALNGTIASFMLMSEAKKRRHGVLLDIVYSDVLQESQSDSASSLNWKVSVQDILATVGYTYEVYRSPYAVIDVIGGLRYWELDTRLTLMNSAGPPADTNVRSEESWVDPLAGVKTKIHLGNSRVYLAFFLGAGGSGGGADKFYDVTANVGYQLTDSIVTTIGYRLYDVDYENDGFVYDVKQEGWVLGVVWILGTNKLAHPG